MEKEYSLDDARKYSEEITSLTKIEDIDITILGRSLKVLAEAKDEIAFRRIIDSYAKCAKTSTDDSMRKNPLSFLEWLCTSLDHDFTTVGLAALKARAGIIEEKLPLKQTQSFFRELYGAHYSFYNPLHN